MLTPWPCRSFRQAEKASASMPRAKWPDPCGPMRRQRVALQCGFGQESEQDTGLADLGENVTARFLADDREAKDCPVEGFRRLEVIDIDGSFDDGLNWHVLAPFNPVPPARHPPGP